MENELDVLALTETWLKETDSTQSHTVSEMTPSGYRCLHVPRSRGKGGSVGILFRSCVSVKQASPSTFKTFENIYVSLEAGSSHLKIYVIYRPPPNNKNRLTVNDFLGELAQMFEDTMQQPGNLVVMGDFNFHWDDPTNSHTRQLKWHDSKCELFYSQKRPYLRSGDH